jgi:hypothetical protein
LHENVVELYGSLALTGIGHWTDIAIATGEIVSSVKLPFALAEAAIVGRSKISVDLSPSGQNDVSVAGVLANEQLDGLVARAVSETTLGLEEATALDLKALLRRVKRSVGLVKEAIARMPTAPADASLTAIPSSKGLN